MSMNGRIQTSSHEKPYARVTNNNEISNNFEEEALRFGFTKTPLSSVYFSKENIDALQQGIRFLVYKRSNGKFTISNQSEDELKIVMRAIYLREGKNRPFNILEQVKELNSHVLEYCVKNITSELQLNQKYKNDISTLPVPLAYGKNESTTGSRVLELKQL